MKYFLSMLLCVFTLSVCAQQHSSNLKPRWLSTLPKSQSPSYIFERGMGEGGSLVQARQKAYIDLVSKIEHERGLKVSSKESIHSEETTYTDKVEKYNKEVFTMECTEDDKEIRLVVRVIDEYTQTVDNKIIAHVLYTVANTNIAGGSYDDEIYTTTSYKDDAAIYPLAIIPGGAQFYKGSYGKGGGILGTSVVLIGGIVGTDYGRRIYQSKLEQTHNAEQRKYYGGIMQGCTAACGVIGALAGVLYIYNWVDAIIAPGARRVIVKPKRVNVAFAPTVSNDGALCFSTIVKF